MIAVLGLAYKQDTNSVKNSPSIALLECLSPYRVRLFDPVVPVDAAPNPRRYGASSELDACKGADVLVIMTPWPQFGKMDPQNIAACLSGKTLLDPYAVLCASTCRAAGLDYLTLGVRYSH